MQNPLAIYIAVTLPIVAVADELIADLVDVVKDVKEQERKRIAEGKGAKGAVEGDAAALYGVAGSLPNKSVVVDLAKGFLDTLYKVEARRITFIHIIDIIACNGDRGMTIDTSFYRPIMFEAAVTVSLRLVCRVVEPHRQLTAGCFKLVFVIRLKFRVGAPHLKKATRQLGLITWNVQATRSRL